MKYIEQPALAQLAQSLAYNGPECSVHTRIEAYSCKNIKRDKKLFRSLENAYKDEAAHSPPLPSWLAVEDVDQTPFGSFDKHSSRKTLYLLIATLNIAFPDHDFSDVRPGHFTKEQNGANVLNALSSTLSGGLRAPGTYSSYPSVFPDFFPKAQPTSSSPSVSSSPYAPPAMMSGTHPTIYRLLDEVITLADCEVFSYTPNVYSDPHASDDDDSDGADSDDDDLPVFEFDEDYVEDEDDRVVKSRPGSLLWSSHWFFLNRKQKRILYITVWARTKAWVPMEETPNERFVGWEGATGAGARAMGITVN